MPFPRPERTPPVTTTYLVLLNGNQRTHALDLRSGYGEAPAVRPVSPWAQRRTVGFSRRPPSGGPVPVTGIQFKAFEARRYQDGAQRPQKVRVDHNSSLSRVEKADDGVRIEFGFTTSYGAIGMVKLEGVLMYKCQDPAATVAAWEKDRNLPQAEAQEVHSAILSAGLPEAVGLAKGVRLPPPIPIPQVRFQQGGTAAAKSPPEGPDAA